MSTPLFDLAARRSRFDPDAEELRRQLAEHARITAELQRRIVSARHYVERHGGQHELLAILAGNDTAEVRS